MPKICIDADGCPVVNETIVVAQDLGINVVIFCDTSHEIVREGAMTVTVSKGNDSADFALVNKIQKGDIVVTQDYGLATMVLAKNGFCIDQNGREYTHQNIDSLLKDYFKDYTLKPLSIYRNFISVFDFVKMRR